MLMADQVATAPCTDPIQEELLAMLLCLFDLHEEAFELRRVCVRIDRGR